MNDIRLQQADVDFLQNAATTEAQHELLASCLGAYADGELPAETHSQIDAHLAGCARCRRELEIHGAVRDRLGKEPVPAASAALRERIASGMHSAPPPVFRESEGVDVAAANRTSRRKWMATGLAIPVVMFSLLVAQSLNTRNKGAPTVAPVAQTNSALLLNNVLADYRRVNAGDLPGRQRDLAAVRAAVPFAFEPLSNPSLRLVNAWTTSLSGEPVAVLAYRWNDRVLYQYFVSEGLLFQSPDIRASIAQQQLVFHKDGEQSLLLWAEPEYGTVLVGEFQPVELADLRAASKDR
ncbi:MAG: zf-HC2 domain-containing protein [Phycisphaerae bacterium]|nr:zf-HC2 domain-containing protein [Gemmatimonadaceae bacterium]